MTRPRIVALVGLTCTFLVGAGFAVLVWSSGRQTGNVAVPPVSAGPKQVVQAYVNALNAHDCDTAEALSMAGTGFDADAWCRNVRSVTMAQNPSIFQAPKVGGGKPNTVDVVVTLNVKWRLFHDDGTFPQDGAGWSYRLTRKSAVQPWRISAEGTG